MRSVILSLAVLAATAMAAPVYQDCAIKYARDVVTEVVDITVTQTVYVTEGAAPTGTPVAVYAQPSTTPCEETAPKKTPVYNAPAPVYSTYVETQPAPSPAPAPVYNAPTTEDQSCLDAHNQYRALHGAPPLTWNSDMASYAEQNTQNCVMAHTGGPYGENLAFGYDNVADAVKAWYDEVSQHDPSNPGFGENTGHFTQLVWKATTQVGCYNRQCGGSQYLMCEYQVPGNVVGNNGQYFSENVQM